MAERYNIRRQGRKQQDGSWEKTYDSGFTGWVEHDNQGRLTITMVDNRTGVKFRWWPATQQAQGGGGRTYTGPPPPTMPGGGTGQGPFYSGGTSGSGMIPHGAPPGDERGPYPGEPLQYGPGPGEEDPPF